MKPAPVPNHEGDIVHPSALPFILVHLGCAAVLWSGISWTAAGLAVGLYWLRMFGVTAGYHRYFSHRAYATSRPFQFILALLAQSSGQKSVLWWAAKHRHHHLHSDTAEDLHSPRQSGVFHSHIGWVFDRRHDGTDLVKVADLESYPELRWLHRYEALPAAALAGLCFLAAGWPGLVVGFCWSTVMVYHATFSINSLAHLQGRRRYLTGDDSRNNWVLALITMGEGWHNNHHAYQSSVRQGFRWWEIDVTFYILKALSWTGLIWDLKSPPESVLRNKHSLGHRVIDRAARQLAGTFDPERIARIVAANMDGHFYAALQHRIAAARHQTVEILANAHLPHLPTRAEIHARAKAMLASTASVEEIVERTHRMVLEAIGLCLAQQKAGA
jgi:stearoyl-CoA desaturase (delta-9 desaturase)